MRFGAQLTGIDGQAPVPVGRVHVPFASLFHTLPPVCPAPRFCLEAPEKAGGWASS